MIANRYLEIPPIIPPGSVGWLRDGVGRQSRLRDVSDVERSGWDVVPSGTKDWKSVSIRVQAGRAATRILRRPK
jgi:hypothetical protein